MVTVIIPAYNRADFLIEAIDSVLRQSYFAGAGGRERLQLVVVDDGSVDDTKERLKDHDGIVEYVYQNHKGVSAARNLGLGLSKGDFIAFLDSDDLWMKEKIQVQMSFLKAFPEARFCSTEEIWIRRGRRVNPKKHHAKHSGWIFDKVLSRCLLSLSSALFRREVFSEVGLFDENLPVCEDYDFGIRLAQRYPVHFIPNPLLIKRGGHPGQLSAEYWGMDRFRVMALEKALALDLTPDQSALVKKEIVKKCAILAKGFTKRNRSDEAKKYLALMAKYKS
jgi:glycosyltransferase involved in cell wall biosynthesis